MKPIRDLLEAVAAGELSVSQAQRDLAGRELQAIDGATIDHGRPERCGFGEVIYAEGKPPELISRIASDLVDRNPQVLITRLSLDAFKECDFAAAEVRYNEIARTVRLSKTQSPPAPADIKNDSLSPIAVITAGSTDEPVAQEILETLAWMNVPTRKLTDIGIAGPQRLLANLHHLDGCAAAVVAAGMEGALSSVVAGHVAYPVIAVPTSVGYGASLGGVAALLSMITSCAANVAVVNIDAGFKGGYIAGLIAHQKIGSPVA